MRTIALHELDAVLADLPTSHIVAHRPSARLVVAPVGCFVLVPVADDVADAVRRSNALAHSARTAIADHVPWVPFVDALAVGARTTHDDGRIDSFVPVDLLRHLLTAGPTVVEPKAVACVRRLLADERLDGWMPDPDRADATIQRCDPASTLPNR